MAKVRITDWRKLPISLTELCIDTTLRCGQAFRWKKLGDDEWHCALHGRILSLRQDKTHLHYKVTWPEEKVASSSSASLISKGAESESGSPSEDNTESLLHHYFNLGRNVTELYEQWSSADPNFNKRAPKFAGVRILKQDPWEALVAFICSSNNNIIRISQMVNNLCLRYGPLVGHVESQPFHDFPTPEALSGPNVESELRALGFGYRAKYLAQTAKIVAKDKPKGWLEDLSNKDRFDGSAIDPLEEGGRPGYRKAHEELLQLQGVGPKVADCVCLMGLGWGESVPVDTHVWQIAQRDYKFGKGRHKSLTKATYDAVGDHFRQLWGKEAGWAHSVLFAADLRTFAVRLTEKREEKREAIVKEESASAETITSLKRKLKAEVVVKDEQLDEKITLGILEIRKAKKKRY